MFWKELDEIRSGKIRRFSQDIYETHVSYFTHDAPALKHVADPKDVKKIKSAICRNHKLNQVISYFTNLEDASTTIHDFLSCSPGEQDKIYGDFENKKTAHPFWKKHPIKRDVIANMPLYRNHDSQVCFDGMHATFANRQADSNIFLSRHFSKGAYMASRHKVLFVGGSLGLTAHDFLNAVIKPRRHRPCIVSMDLFKPQDIFSRLKKETARRRMDMYSKFFQNDGFDGFRHLHYVAADLQALPFNKGSFTMVDACNVIGYVTNYNRRLRIVRNLLDLVAPGGFIRLVSPGLEAIFEQIVFKKRRSMDWEIAYLSLTGKTLPQDFIPEVAYRRGKKLTDLVRTIQNRLSEIKRKISKKNIIEKSIFEDICVLSPINFGAGIIDKYRLLARRGVPYDTYAENLTSALASLAKL